MRQQGSSLIEVMVALFVLGVGMLGVFAMQAQTQQFNHSAYYYSRAVMLASDMAENLRTTPTAANSYSLFYDDPTPSAKECEGRVNACNAQELKNWHLKAWRESVTRQLPDGRSEVVADGQYITIKIQFDDSRTSVDKQNPDVSEYILVTEV